MVDLEKFANIVMPRIFGSSGEDGLINFYSLNCLEIREDNISPDFLKNTYRCYESKGKDIINTKNYKYKKGIPSLLPVVILRLFQYMRIPSRIQLFKKEVNIEEEIEFNSTLNMSTYKTCLNSDLTILIGLSLIKNPRIQTLLLINLNLYDIDIQTLIGNIQNL